MAQGLGTHQSQPILLTYMIKLYRCCHIVVSLNSKIIKIIYFEINDCIVSFISLIVIIYEQAPTANSQSNKPTFVVISKFNYINYTSFASLTLHF